MKLEEGRGKKNEVRKKEERRKKEESRKKLWQRWGKVGAELKQSWGNFWRQQALNPKPSKFYHKP